MTYIETVILEYTRLAREMSELPLNAESVELYAPIEARRQEIRRRIRELREVIDDYVKGELDDDGFRTRTNAV